MQPLHFFCRLWAQPGTSVVVSFMIAQVYCKPFSDQSLTGGALNDHVWDHVLVTITCAQKTKAQHIGSLSVSNREIRFVTTFSYLIQIINVLDSGSVLTQSPGHTTTTATTVHYHSACAILSVSNDICMCT